MDTVEIPLLKYRITLRRLPWREEFALKPAKNEDPTLNFLAHAMVGVSGMAPIASPAEALKLLKSLPQAIRSRVWLIYRGSLPEMRHFITKSLYEAPKPTDFNRRVKIEEGERDEKADAATRQMESRFGVQETREAQAVGQQLFAQAKQRGALVPASPENEGAD